MLAEVSEASIPMERMEEYQQNYLKSGGTANLADFFEVRGKRAVLLPALRNRITWAQYSLVTDASFNEFHLIVCRRALGDFGPGLRRRALQLFHDSLALFGVLGLDRELDDSDLLRANYVPVMAHQGRYFTDADGLQVHEAFGARPELEQATSKLQRTKRGDVGHGEAVASHIGLPGQECVEQG
eukprot:gene37157-60403_t